MIQDSQSIQNTSFQSSWCSQCFKLHGIELGRQKMSATKVQQKKTKINGKKNSGEEDNGLWMT